MNAVIGCIEASSGSRDAPIVSAIFVLFFLFILFSYHLYESYKLSFIYIYGKLNPSLQVLEPWNSVFPVQVSDSVLTGIGQYRYRPAL